jgi:hypothetical protein
VHGGCTASAPTVRRSCKIPAVPTYRLHDTTGEDLGLVEHFAPNLEPGDVVVLADGREAIVTTRVEAEPGWGNWSRCSRSPSPRLGSKPTTHSRSSASLRIEERERVAVARETETQLVVTLTLS